MIETHPFENFVPPNSKYLILGSFVGKEAVKGTNYSEESYDWFYGTRRNQFWSIIECVYQTKLTNKEEKQNLFSTLHIAITDLIYKCERRYGSNLDSNLTNKVYNTTIFDIVDNYPIGKIFFTSVGVRKEFTREFKDIVNNNSVIELITLPSPSPRFARMSKQQKIEKYIELLPKIKI